MPGRACIESVYSTRRARLPTGRNRDRPSDSQDLLRCNLITSNIPGLSGDRPSCAYDAHNPGWWKTIPQEYLSCETERNCVSARTGGEQLEVSCWSVTTSAK
jgi:hypothetical protein